MSELVRIITAVDPAIRNLPLSSVCDHATVAQLMEECQALDRFRRDSGNLYERVRALFFLSAIFRYHLPPKLAADATGRISYDGYVHLLQRRFEEAIRDFGKSLLAADPPKLSPARLLRHIAAWDLKRCRTRCERVSVPSGATSGCSVSDTFSTTR